MNIRLLSALGLNLALLLTGPSETRADSIPLAIPEYTMKAAYLYNFAQLTDWPMQSGASDGVFNLCVFGQDEVLSALESLRRKTINGHQLRPVRITESSDARQCHLLYVGEMDAGRAGRVLDSLRKAPILTVTDDPRLTRSGVMLLIVPEERRLSFEVNVEVARSAQLKFSSKLLGLAKRVIGG